MRGRLERGEPVVPMYGPLGLAWLHRQAELAEHSSSSERVVDLRKAGLEVTGGVEVDPARTDHRSPEEATMTAAPTPAAPAAEALLGALAGRPRATAAELAGAAGIGRSTAGKLLATLAAQGRVQRQPGGLKDGRRTADRWTLPATTPPTQDPGSPPVAPTPLGDQPPTRSGRLRSGALRQLVVGCLAERPGQALSPTAIATRLDRSAGAVANALQVLTGQGAVVQTQAKPRRYTIAPASGDQTDVQR